MWLLYDTGIRIDELCRLKRSDLDLTEKRIRVTGKGDKERTIYFGKFATRALWNYLREISLDADEPLFQAEAGRGKGGPLNRRSADALFGRLGKVARIEGVRCSPHTPRHTHAIDYLRYEGTIEGLKERLGHTSLTMTLRYVRLAEADLQNQRRHSPADQLAKSNAPRRDPRQARGKAQIQVAVVSPVIPDVKQPSLGAQTRKITQAKLDESQVREIKRRLANRAAGAKDIASGFSWKQVT